MIRCLGYRVLAWSWYQIRVGVESSRYVQQSSEGLLRGLKIGKELVRDPDQCGVCPTRRATRRGFRETSLDGIPECLEVSLAFELAIDELDMIRG